MRRSALCVALLASLSLGCEFVSEINAEFERGEREMERYALTEKGQSQRGSGADPASPETSGGSDGGSVSQATRRARAAAANWWKKARTLATDEKDPSIVRCDLAGNVHFMRDSECRARGGRVSRG